MLLLHCGNAAVVAVAVAERRCRQQQRQQNQGVWFALIKAHISISISNSVHMLLLLLLLLPNATFFGGGYCCYCFPPLFAHAAYIELHSFLPLSLIFFVWICLLFSSPSQLRTLVFTWILFIYYEKVFFLNTFDSHVFPPLWKSIRHIKREKMEIVYFCNTHTHARSLILYHWIKTGKKHTNAHVRTHSTHTHTQSTKMSKKTKKDKQIHTISRECCASLVRDGRTVHIIFCVP